MGKKSGISMGKNQAYQWQKKKHINGKNKTKKKNQAYQQEK